MKAANHVAGSVGLVFVALGAALSLDVIWRIGRRVQTWFKFASVNGRSEISRRDVARASAAQGSRLSSVEPSRMLGRSVGEGETRRVTACA